jgi:hypothetical protein
MTTTPSFIDMECIHRFLRPMAEGGMGAGTEAWIAYCLKIPPERMRAAIDALAAQGRIQKWPDGSWRHA